MVKLFMVAMLPLTMLLRLRVVRLALVNFLNLLRWSSFRRFHWKRQWCILEFLTRPFSLGFLTWLPRHSSHCNNQVLRTTLFHRQSTNTPCEEDEQAQFQRHVFCVCSARPSQERRCQIAAELCPPAPHPGPQCHSRKCTILLSIHCQRIPHAPCNEKHELRTDA